MGRHVRGVLFVDYVRMIRGKKGIAFSDYLRTEDLPFLDESIDLDGWYPMETFERLGIAILHKIALYQLEGVQMWGSFQVDQVRRHFDTLIAEGDPRETMMRFGVLAKGFFDYDALEVVSVVDDHAVVSVAYGMGTEAEKTACHQSLGFFERLVEIAGARDVAVRFTAKSWEGAPRTIIEVHFTVDDPHN